jgi:hypothetical protein
MACGWKLLGAGLAALIAGGGTAAVVNAAPGAAPAAAPAAASAAASAGRHSATEMAATAHDRARASTVARPPASRPAAVRVAPLRRLTPPDVAVYLPAAITVRQWEALVHLPGVTAATVVARGTLDTPAGRVGAIGVDPSQLRAFTPKLSAESDPLWDSVARGEVTFDFAAAGKLRGFLGLPVVLAGRQQRILRLGAFASIGIPGATVVVDRAVAAQLGLAAGREVLVAAPGVGIDYLTSEITSALGSAVSVRDLRPVEVDQTYISGIAAGYIPPEYLALYREAATTCPGLSWTILAAIGTVESGNGANTGRSSAGAEGPMQFLPSTFAAYGVAVGSGHTPDINSPADAIFSAARYLCAEGAGLGGQSLYDAIFAYNHADWYVREVLAIARLFA